MGHKHHKPNMVFCIFAKSVKLVLVVRDTYLLLFLSTIFCPSFPAPKKIAILDRLHTIP